MLTNVEHIGIAVRDLTASNALFTSLLNVAPYKSEAVEAEGVLTSFFLVNPGQKAGPRKATIGKRKSSCSKPRTLTARLPNFWRKKGKEFTTSLLPWMTSKLKWTG